jgi:hypothetical protein
MAVAVRSVGPLQGRLPLIWAGLLASGCGSPDGPAPDAGSDSGVFDVGDDGGGGDHGAEAGTTRSVDLLVVTYSSYGEGAEVATQAQSVVARLAPALVDAGVDLRVGVISADLGGVGTLYYEDIPITACGRPCDRRDGTSSSDEGKLLVWPNCWPEEPDRCCAWSSERLPYPPPAVGYAPWLDAADPVFGEWIVALVTRDDGCALSQPLESLCRALDATTNPGFLREGSVLAIFLVSRRDDCSVADPAAVAPFTDELPGSLPARCGQRSERLHPVERYVDRLLAVRPADRLAVGLFAGMDADLRWCTGSEPGCPAGSESCSETTPCLLPESCPGADHWVQAAPRLHRFARMLGSTTTGRPVAVPGSSCAFHDGPATEEIDALLAEILDRVRR